MFGNDYEKKSNVSLDARHTDCIHFPGFLYRNSVSGFKCRIPYRVHFLLAILVLDRSCTDIKKETFHHGWSG
jgi:hypothetical protein